MASPQGQLGVNAQSGPSGNAATPTTPTSGGGTGPQQAPIPTATVSFTSDELNYLVYRYLLESGFTHAGYTFGYESDVLNRLAGPEKHHHHHQHGHGRDDGDAASELKLSLERKEAMQRILQNVQQGALISIVQKGLQYVEVETHLMEDGSARPCSAPLSLLHPHTCVEPSQTNADAGEAAAKAKAKAKAKKKEKEKAREKEKVKKEDAEMDEPTVNGVGSTKADDSDKVKAEASGVVAMEDVRHDSGDGTARLWVVPAQPGSSGSSLSIILENAMNAPENKDVTTMDWNPTGELLATGSYDGKARVWAFEPKPDPEGAKSDSENPLICSEGNPVTTNFGTVRLVATIANHSGPIFSLRWNKTGDLLLSGSVDKSCVVWDWRASAVKGRWRLHDAPTLDVDWAPPSGSSGPHKDVFASCSSDHLIQIVGTWSDKPLSTLKGHTAEVNCVRWDPEGRLLGSCGDDGKVFVWSWDGLEADGVTGRGSVYRELVGHEREVYTLRWCPQDTSGKKLMATGSFDSTVRIWDVLSGACLHHLKHHTEPIYSVAFHPRGQYVAVGSFDHGMTLWNVADGTLVKRYEGDSGIFEVSWSTAGDKISICFADKRVSVVYAALLGLPGLS
ncbi:WD40-repeat-containing domain protein [Hyaloraphidium curvatum]|nr:WD40-repeat-containing domain protein [Hyaloraphidium curvatum]